MKLSDAPTVPRTSIAQADFRRWPVAGFFAAASFFLLAIGIRPAEALRGFLAGFAGFAGAASRPIATLSISRITA